MEKGKDLKGRKEWKAIWKTKRTETKGSENAYKHFAGQI